MENLISTEESPALKSAEMIREMLNLMQFPIIASVDDKIYIIITDNAFDNIIFKTLDLKLPANFQS